MLQSDASITLARTVATDQFRVNDDATTSRRISPFDEHGQFDNTRAPAGGLYFDGSGGFVYSTLTGQSIGTDDFSLTGYIDVPASNPTQTLGLVALSSSNSTAAQANGVNSYIDTSSNLHARIYGAATTDYNDAALSLTAWAGKTVPFVMKRVGTVFTLKINASTQTTTDTTGGTPPTWAGSVTNTYLTVGLVSSGISFIGRISRVGFAAFALSDAECVKLMEDGGVPQDKHKWGSQAILLASDFSAGVGGYSDGSGAITLTGNVDTDADGAGVPPSDNWLKITRTALTSGGILVQGPSSSPLTRRKVFEVTADVFVETGSPITHLKATVNDFGANFENTRLSPTGGVAISAGSVTAFRQVIATDAATANAGRNQNAVFRICNSSGVSTSVTTGNQFYLKNVGVRELGFNVFLPLDDGLGLQARDVSTNKLDGVISTTGVSHVIAKQRGTVRGTLTWAATHEAKSLLGHAIAPDGFRLEAITLKASAGSAGSGATIGTSASATRYLGTTTFTTAKLCKRGSELSNGGLPGGTGATNLDIVIDPDTSNYTGSIQVTAEIAQTEGTST